MRLRIIDWNSRWFWFVCFFRKDFSGSVDRHVEINLYGPQKWSGTWFHFWMWEKMPDMRLQVIVEPSLLDKNLNPVNVPATNLSA